MNVNLTSEQVEFLRTLIGNQSCVVGADDFVAVAALARSTFDALGEARPDDAYTP